MTPQASGCTMANAANNGAFVQAVIVSPAGQLSVYDPLVITQGTIPAAPPVVPQIPPGSVAGIWTGFNGTVLTIAGPGGALFSQGLPGSPFGQVAAVNAAAFSAAARQLAQVPALGTARDGLPCPTTRDFSLVDQDPSDNVTAQYILTGTGQTAQDNAANEAALGVNLVSNGSDNNLLARFVDPALGKKNRVRGVRRAAARRAGPGPRLLAPRYGELLVRADVPGVRRRLLRGDRLRSVSADEPGRALPQTVIDQLLDPAALDLLEAMHGAAVRAMIELQARAGGAPASCAACATTASAMTRSSTRPVSSGRHPC